MDDPLPALFMAAYLRQLNTISKEPIRTIAIYDGLELNRTHFQNFEREQKTHIEASQFPLHDLIDDWLILPTLRYNVSYPNPLNFKKMMKERKCRQKELGAIQALFADHMIDPSLVVEIWSRDAFVDQHFHFLCPQAKIYFFEHGLSDIRNALTTGQEDKRLGRLSFLPNGLAEFLRSFRSRVSRFLEERFYYFSKSSNTRVTRVSLLADEIRAGNNRGQKLEPLNSSGILAASQALHSHEVDLARAVEGPCALILLMYVYHKPWNQNFERDQSKMLRDFEMMLAESYGSEFEQQGIKTLVFKGRFFHEDFSAEGVRAFDTLKQKYKVIYLSDYSPRNFPTEFYLGLLQPKIILSAYSSASVFAKKILPEINSYTYDRWFTQYIRNQFNTHFDDFAWYRPCFEERFGSIFKKILPLEKN